MKQVVVLGFVVLTSVVTLVWAVDAPPGVDPTLVWLQAAGFPVWAIVVGWAVTKVTDEMKSISARLEAFINSVDKRVTILEMKVNLKENV